MKTFLLICLLISSQIFAQFSTPGTGVIWDLDSLATHSGGVVGGNFPNYTINNKIIISYPDRIDVLPGSIVTFISATGGFEVNGIFNAVGTPTDSIIFTSSVQDSTGFYEGFRFNAAALTFPSTIQYARIYYADYGMRCVDANPILSNSYLYKCGRGVQLSNSDAQILNNVIERSFEYGITMTLDSSPLIEGNHLLKNNTQGTSAKNQISIGLQGNNSPIIRNNIIEGGESIPTGGISLWVNGVTAFSNAVIEGNIIFNNSFGITLYSTTDGLVNAMVSDNIIYNNNINPNTLVSGSGININGGSFNQPLIKRNKIFGNWWGITIQNGTTVQAGPQPNIGNIENADTTDDGQNYIYGNIQGSDVFDLYNNCTNDIYAQNNDWGVYDSTSIEEHVFHKVDNIAHGYVFFMPFVEPITVLSPNGGELFFMGSPIEITWTSSPSIDSVKIRLSLFNGLSLNTITESTPSDGSYEWIVQAPQISWDCKIRISDVNDSTIFDESDTTFVIDTFPSVEDSNEFTPAKFSLDQNYPNPFNPVTKIKYTIPNVTPSGVEGSLVVLKVFDVLGKEIATLVNEEKLAGTYEVEFSAANLPSGVYFYKLAAGSFVETKKMILLK